MSHATHAVPGRVNEDLVAAGDGWALVLDGATPVPGVDSGCRHGVPWLVRRLAAALTARLILADPAPLAELVAGAIGDTTDAHAGRCDLDNPDTPSATMSVVRVRDTSLDYLVLCDSPVLLRHRDGTVTRLADDRLAEWYGYSWPDIFARLRAAGPDGIIALLRAAETERPRLGAKQHDDATVVHIRF
jgi:hypothetical protein